MQCFGLPVAPYTVWRSVLPCWLRPKATARWYTLETNAASLLPAWTMCCSAPCCGVLCVQYAEAVVFKVYLQEQRLARSTEMPLVEAEE